MDIDKPAHKRDLIEGLMRGLEVLNCFDGDTQKITASELALRLSISRAAARRFLMTLAHVGYLESDGRHYVPTVKVLNLAQVYVGAAQLPRAVTPYLQRLSRELQFSTNCSVLQGEEVVYVARAYVPLHITTGYEPGDRLQATTTAAGRVLLAALDDGALNLWIERAQLVQFTPHTIVDKQQLLKSILQARTDGYAISESMIRVGVRGLAVPLRNRKGQVLAAISVSMPEMACSTQQTIDVCLPHLLTAAQDLRTLV